MQAGPPLGTEHFKKKLREKILAESTKISKIGMESFHRTSEFIRPQPLRQCNDDKPASAMHRSLVNGCHKNKILVRACRIENHMMFFGHWHSQKLSRFGGSNSHARIRLSPSEVITLLEGKGN
jgi:hypothetical protein